MNGDGRTDFVVVRGTGSPFAVTASAVLAPRFLGARGRVMYDLNNSRSLVAAPQVVQEYWFALFNGGGGAINAAWGDAAAPDWSISADFDGDGKDDLAVWRPGAAGNAAFFIIRSSDGAVTYLPFGQDGDDPSVVADYDGDGIDDPAVFRCGVSPGQCTFFYRGSFSNPSGTITAVDWGNGAAGTIDAVPGDYDGDGKADFCVYREDPSIPGQGQYALHKSDGSPDEFVDWGLYHSDILVPGDFDGDKKTDFNVIRVINGSYVHFLLTRTGTLRVVNWGITNDVPATGDYDGDGKADLAIWRGSTTPGQSAFFVLYSSDGTAHVQNWGQCEAAPCDEPLASWQVH